MTRMPDEQVDAMPLGNLRHVGDAMADTPAEVQSLLFTFLTAIANGGPVSNRQYALVAWILDPMLRGGHANQLPFMGKPRGRPKKLMGDLTATTVALAVHKKRRKTPSLDEAIAEVAGSPEREDSVRGHYQRANKAGLDAVERSARQLKIHLRKRQKIK